MKRNQSNHLVKALFLIIIVLGFTAYTHLREANAGWKQHEYKVIKVVDGDTAIVADGNIKFKVRFASMDIPNADNPLQNLPPTI